MSSRNNRIPKDQIDLIRRSSDIVELISDYVQLKKQGQQYIGLCPFHDENTPSFSVSPEKQLYHCFGCGAGGNVFSFLMEHEKLTFVEAVMQLAKQANIDIPQIFSTNQEQQQKGPHAEIRSAHKVAATLYHRILLLTEQGERGRTYVKERGFTREQIEHFQIGFAPDRWDALTTILTKQSFSMEHMVAGGLLGNREETNTQYDRFRNRLMFPIWDQQGNVIAFGGRTVVDERPKYLNSIDSPIFKKSETLYGLHLARKYIRKEATAILFEGYIDVIAAWGADVKNGVATLGTSLTQNQARLLRRNAETVIICYDADDAGIEATLRSATLLERAGCTVRIANLPDGFDPDDYIRTYGAKRFQANVIGNSSTLMSFKMTVLRKGKNMQNDGERMQYINDVLVEIASLRHAVERDYYLRKIAEEFSLSLAALKQELFQLTRKSRRDEHSYNKQKITYSKIESNSLLPAYHNAERLLLAHMMRDAHIANLVQEEIGGSFNLEYHEAISAYLFSYYGEGNDPDPSEFIEWLQDDTLKKIATELAMLQINEQCSEEELYDYMERIKIHPKKEEIKKDESEVIKRNDDPIQVAKMLMDIHKRKQKLH